MHWLGYSLCPWSPQMRERETFPRAAVPAFWRSRHPQHCDPPQSFESLVCPAKHAFFWSKHQFLMTGDKTISLQCFVLFALKKKKAWQRCGLKVSVKTRQSFFSFFFLSQWDSGVHPSPLSVAKLHPRMTYRRHICRKYAMKLCGSCTIGAFLPPLRCPAVCWGAVSEPDSFTQRVSSLSHQLASYLCQRVKTGTWLQPSTTKRQNSERCRRVIKTNGG